MFEYGNAMDRYLANPIYVAGSKGDFTGRDNYGLSPGEKAVAPVDSIGINQIGKSIIAGHGQGSFRNVLQAAIKQGAASVEMALAPDGGEPGVSAEGYGRIARRELKEIALANGVEINSVHAPSQIGNLSGRTQDSFSESARAMSVNEVKKSIDFAADVGMGGSVVVHTGEFDRSIMDNFGSGEYRFKTFPGEEKFGQIYWVDAKSGRMQHITRTMEFQYIPRGPDGHVILDDNGNIPEAQTFTYNKLVELWQSEPDKFKEMFNRYDKIFAEPNAKYLNAIDDSKPLDQQNPALKAAFGLYMAQQLADAEFRKSMYLDHYLQGKKQMDKIDTAIKFYEKLSPEERERHSVTQGGRSDLIPPDVLDPLEYLKEQKKSISNNMKAAEDYSMSGTIAERQVIEQAKSFRTPQEYALEKSTKSLAELGIYAMQRSMDSDFTKTKKRDLYVAPENIFPEMGYGSHPEELIAMVEKSRDEMVRYLTQKKIKVREFDGTEREVENPYFQKGISEKKAKEEAEKHIKATLDFQHLGMWRKHFQQEIKDNGQMETLQETEQRFQKWYMEQIDLISKKNKEENLLGNIHVVDGMGGSGHTHLPAGEGVNPIKTALLKLVNAGYTGVMNSEGFEYNTTYGANEQLFRTWNGLSSPIYSIQAQGRQNRWTDVMDKYFGYTNIPPYVFGSYVPSNDWTLWSQVPLD